MLNFSPSVAPTTPPISLNSQFPNSSNPKAPIKLLNFSQTITPATPPISLYSQIPNSSDPKAPIKLINFSQTVTPTTTPISLNSQIPNSISPIVAPIEHSTNTNNFNLKPMKAMELILNCNDVCNITDILDKDVSNKTFLTVNNYDHKKFFCN